MVDPVIIFKCPCEGNKYKLAGMPNNNLSSKDKKEYGELIAIGCNVITIPLEQYKKENWTWCPLHFK
jgi:hypothetical protein